MMTRDVNSRVCASVCVHVYACICAEERRRNVGLHYEGGKDWNMPLKAASSVLLQASAVSGVNFAPNFCLITSNITSFRFCNEKTKRMPQERAYFLPIVFFFFFFQTIQRFFDIESRNLGFYERWFGIRFELLTYINKVVFSATDHT